ncbi:hypothetical protein RND81_06G228100 [Saponaria officinalis]
MDYDDDDISRQNLQLASESRSRSSSVLRPYDFPKFDFDDNLQGHLRFDSLVETEVFLGIQSQEDNQWIEEYSRVSNGMEINSTPADSCSISRRDNVWSEATSSESVEMLLKSVGQEETIPAASIVDGTNVCDDQGASARHVESDTDLDMRNTGTTGPHVEVHKYSSENKCSDKQLPLAEVSCEHPQNLTLDSVCAGSGMSGNNELDTKPTDEYLQEPKTFDCSQVGKLSTSEASLQIDANVSPVSSHESTQVKYVSTEAGFEDIMNMEGKTGKHSIDISTIGGTCGADAVKASLDCSKANDFRSISSKKECELTFPEGVEKNVSGTSIQIDDCDVKALATSNDKRMPLGGCQDGSSTDGTNPHSTELGFAEHCTSPDQKKDSSTQLIPGQDYPMSEDVQTSQSQSTNLSETPVLMGEDSKVLIARADWIDNTDTGKSKNIDLLSSDAENHQTGKVEGCVNDSPVTQNVPDAGLAGNVADDSRHVIEENLAHEQAERSTTGEAICESSEQNEKLPVCPGNIEPENVETLSTHLGAQSVGDEMVKGNESLDDLQNQISGGIKLESDVMVTVADRLDNGLGKSSVIGFPKPDSTPEDDGLTKDTDAQYRSGGNGASEGEAVSDYTQIPLLDTSLQSVKKCNEMNSSKPSSTEANNSLGLVDPNVNIDCEKANSKTTCDVAVGGGDNHEATMMKPGENRDSTPVAVVDKASCGSPTIISSSEPSQMESNEQEETRSSEVTENDVKDSQHPSEDINGKDSSKDDNSFTFKVNATPDTSREPGKSWPPFNDTDKCNSPNVGKESMPSRKGKSERLPSPKTVRPIGQTTDALPLQGTSKGTYERKGRRASGKGATKESSKKGSQAKGTSQENSAGIVDRGLNNSLTTSSSPYVQFGHMQSYGSADDSSKLSPTGSLPTSNLPDLNASALNKSTSTSPTSRQPFTDSQQVQLRAQIFVYGSLIQGTAPDEACMISAFGPSDAGRITWDPVWRTAIERVRTQKSSSCNAATPLHSQSGARASDLAVQHSAHQSKAQGTPVSKVSSKGTSTTMASPMIPLSSPLWSISTPLRGDNVPSSTMHKGPTSDFQQAVPPLHSFHTPPIRSFHGHTSWPSQSCFPGPWLASPQSATFSSSVRFQPVTMTETVKLTPVKDNSSPIASGVKHMTSTPAVHSVGPSPLYGMSQLRDTKAPPSELHSSDLKPRKRKKTPASDNAQSASASEPHTLPLVIHSVDALQSSPVAPAPVLPSDVALGLCVADNPTVYSTVPSKMFETESTRTVACSEETVANVVEAKTQAENAAVLAANAVTHCEDLWGKLAKQKESGLPSETETKLISAAAAIAAAASVAKAAAAAAKVAFNVALQAKLLADDAFLSGKPGAVVQSSAPSSIDAHNIGKATPASILKGEKSCTESNSILVAAKEAAKRKIEAASAASKQAENLDAIVKAAELAASAVSQAGKIVAMGEPLRLVDLIEAGPDGYWKLPPAPTEFSCRSKDENKEQSAAVDLKEITDIHVKSSEVDLVAKGGSRKRSHDKMRQRGRFKDSVDARMSFTDGIMGSVDTSETKSMFGGDGQKSTAVTSEPEIAPRTSSMQNEHDISVGTILDDSIKEGSPVEVLRCGGSLKSAWYSACVVKLEERKAYVCYSDLSSEEGSGNLCEWVHLEGEGEKAPVIRAAHPLNSLQYQGTRKRRRAALVDYAWGVGDKVDVWIDDCWWEGVVTEKNEKDDTTLKVHFPGQGETSVVRAWNLRTSRSWIDGKWVECNSWKAHHSSDQSDTPQEKRQRMGSPVIAIEGKDELNNEEKLAVGNPAESKNLPLLASERTFNIGKNTKVDNKGVARRPLRSGQQKEGSRVIFGVPKPTGKTQKFMEVSKHFPASKGDKNKESSGQVKSAKYLMPQATGSQGWKLPTRNFSREKRPVEPKPRIPSTRKSHRTLPQRDNIGSRSGDVDSKTDHGSDVENSDGHDANSSLNSTDHGLSVTDETAEAPLSSLLSHSFNAGSKKAPLSNTRSGRLNRGKIAPSGGKLNKIEEDRVYTADTGKSVNEAAEPRRSNRRFQPTHRLLEGLQSSMVIPKMPPLTHDKGQRNPSRNVFARGK